MLDLARRQSIHADANACKAQKQARYCGDIRKGRHCGVVLMTVRENASASDNARGTSYSKSGVHRIGRVVLFGRIALVCVIFSMSIV